MLCMLSRQATIWQPRSLSGLTDQAVQALRHALAFGLDQIAAFLTQRVPPAPHIELFLERNLAKLGVSNQNNLRVRR